MWKVWHVFDLGPRKQSLPTKNRRNANVVNVSHKEEVLWYAYTLGPLRFIFNNFEIRMHVTINVGQLSLTRLPMHCAQQVYSV
jgi:hypothetical protein